MSRIHILSNISTTRRVWNRKHGVTSQVGYCKEGIFGRESFWNKTADRPNFFFWNTQILE
jgi:hypothetical protein